MALAPCTVRNLASETGDNACLFIVFELAGFAANLFRQFGMKIVGREKTHHTPAANRSPQTQPPLGAGSLTRAFSICSEISRPRTVSVFVRAQAFDNEAYRVNFTPEAPESYELLNDIGTIRERRTLCATWRNNTGCVAYSVGQKEGDFVCSC